MPNPCRLIWTKKSRLLNNNPDGLYNYDSMAAAIVKGLTGQVANRVPQLSDNWISRQTYMD